MSLLNVLLLFCVLVDLTYVMSRSEDTLADLLPWRTDSGKHLEKKVEVMEDREIKKKTRKREAFSNFCLWTLPVENSSSSRGCQSSFWLETASFISSYEPVPIADKLHLCSQSRRNISSSIIHGLCSIKDSSALQFRVGKILSNGYFIDFAKAHHLWFVC